MAEKNSYKQSLSDYCNFAFVLQLTSQTITILKFSGLYKGGSEGAKKPPVNLNSYFVGKVLILSENKHGCQFFISVLHLDFKAEYNDNSESRWQYLSIR